jgi:uncharacterized heparinase superfamily protein
MLYKSKLYFNTVKYLKPKQLYYQLVRRCKRSKIPFKIKLSEPVYSLPRLHIRELDLDSTYLSRFDIKKLMENRIVILNEEYRLHNGNWNNPKASHLWNFNLHYMEYLISLAANYYKTGDIECYYKFKDFIISWITSNRTFENDAWQAYTISVRIPNWLICLDLFGEIFDNDFEFRKDVLESIYVQYQYLLKNQERHLLGNHYFENLKTILICSLCFKDDKTYKKYIKLLKKEIEEQILEDGLHYELSIMYHKIILEGLLRVAVCLRERKPDEFSFLIPTIQKMVDALASLEKGMGKTPLFNDAGDGVAKDTQQLVNTSNRLFGIEPQYRDCFAISGYHKLYKGNIAIMFDTGKLGPDYMPGHGHCDALSFELSIDEKPVFVNSGTYQYQGELRNFFRSTEAHNTLKIGDQQQSELWGEHRAGRRIYDSAFSVIKGGVLGSYRNYLGNIHQRKIFFDCKDRLIIQDKVNVKKEQTIHTYLHLAPGLTVVEKDEGIWICDKQNIMICKIGWRGIHKYILHNEGLITSYSQVFGVIANKNVIEFLWSSSQGDTDFLIEF